MARTPPTAIMLLLVVVLAALASVSARSSPQCPNGCIIASVVHPNRTCKCVVPQCNNPEEQQQVEQALMTASTIRRKQIRRPRIAAFDCDFCNRAPNTYASFDDCYVADVAFQPIGESIKPALYPTLAAAAGAIDGDISAQQATCPPTTAAGCTDVSSFTRWETLHAGSTATRDVTINGNVVLHGCAQPSNTVTARTITVAPGATLVIGDGTLNFNFKRLVVNGTFQMGTPSCPIRSGITVTVPGGDETNGVDVDKAGTYDVHGFVQGLTWTRVAATVPAGSKIITLQEAVQWQAGNEIVLVTTTWKDELVNQNEVLTIASVSADGLTVTTQQTIKFNHYGGEYKAEVALLTRRILFTSDNSSSTSGIGPHTTMFGPNARITGAAFQRWGARNKPGRYSIHFHLAGDAPQAYIKNNAVYNSNWRCITVHGTNDVYLYGNVGFNVPGHCYYLEDGVEERNVLERNLAAYVHPIQTAGTSGGQQGTDRWQSAALFDPSDSGASGFYALNAYNTWLNNAASGGFSGFTFPHAPRAIKDHKNMKKADGFPFDPSERPFILFKGNTAHSTAYFWEHNAAVYVGGMLFYKIHPSNGQEKLFYNNGRGSIQAEPLCPDPNWPAGDDGNYKDCWVGSSRSTKSADGKSDGFLIMQDTLTALANVGVNSWGDRVEVYNLQAYDVSRSAQYLGQSFMKDSYIRINTTNSVNGWSQWPWSKSEYYWDHYVIKGFEWYDTSTTTILSNITFDNYKFVQFTTNPADDWWYYNTPSAFRMLSYWDQYKPDKTMMVTRDIKCTNCDLGTSCSNNFCPGNAFFRVEETYRGASWYFNWLDQDGSVVRHVQPNKPAGPYLITSQPDWWKLDDATSWKEPKFNNPWITPMPADEVAARVEMRVENNGNRFTVQSFEGQDMTRVGYVSQFGDVSKRVVLTKTEGTTGVTGKIGWYTVWNTTQSGFHAPKRLELILFNVPVARAVLWASCWPAGTTFTISKKFAWSDCLNVNALARATSRDAVLAGNGENYWVDANNCLHLKLTDPGHPWAYTDKFERAGMYVQEPIRWYDLRYVITAAGTAMSCSNTHFCPLPGDPASRVPPAVPALPVQCKDNPPPNEPLCGAVKCQWNYWPGCTNTQIVSGQYCQATCGTCPAVVPTSPSPKPSPSPSPSPSPKPSPSPTAMTTNVALTAVWSASRARWTCTAVVTVTNSITNAAVSAAAVTGRWQTYNDYTGYPYTATRNTTNKGNLTMVTSRLMTNATRGCRFSVMNVTKSGFVASGSMPSATWTFWGSARRQKRQAQRAARRAAMQG